MKLRGISIDLELVRVDNVIKKPGPVFLEIARRAYALGAEYMYRVNDDTEFHGRWPTLYSDTLMRLPKPYGVIGPRSTTTQNRILTHDFVHRTHMEIFEQEYYPRELPDWWMDDWITSVYGCNRTFMSKTVTVTHHVKYHGRRHDTKDMDQDQLASLVTRGRDKILEWMKSNDGLSSQIDQYLACSSTSFLNGNALMFVTDSGNIENFAIIPDDKTTIKRKKLTRSRSRPSSKPAVLPKLPITDCTGQFNISLKGPLVAVMSGSTSRNEDNPSVAVLSLFTIMLPSLIRSLDCGFRYIVVVGYDRGDVFYDTAKGRSEISSWFEEEIHSTMKLRGISIDLELVRVDNVIKKPGPVFLEIARRAYALGAEYMYRVNDDTEFHGRWPTLYSDTLMRLPKPYGVIGPRSTTTQNRILTHDFVHRTHMEIFEQEYYPRELPDWWMDDWITSVYGFSRTFMSKTVTVIHHVKYHGRRYSVNDTNQDRLASLVTRGRDKILEWMRSPGNEVEHRWVVAFENERSAYNEDKLRYVSGLQKYEKFYKIKATGISKSRKKNIKKTERKKKVFISKPMGKGAKSVKMPYRRSGPAPAVVPKLRPPKIPPIQ